MRLKDLFVVRKGEKVTEKCLRRVLISSICSILLCMSCLVGTTWAWFTVSITDTGNVIQIGPDVAVTVGGEPIYSGTTLTPSDTGSRQITLTHLGTSDSFKQKAPVYVVLTVSRGEHSSSVYVMLNRNSQPLLLELNEESRLSWDVFWTVPGDVPQWDGGMIILVEPEPEPPTEPPVDETDTPVEGTDTPEEGTDTPEEGTDTPKDDTVTPEEGTDSSEDGAELPGDESDSQEDNVDPETT